MIAVFKEKKGQSALEYLMTYGWGLVVVAVVIAALVLLTNPALLGSNSFSGFNNNLLATNVKYPTVASPVLELQITNISARTLSVSSIEVKDETGLNIPVTQYFNGSIWSGPYTLKPGEKARLGFLNPFSWTTGKHRIVVRIIATDKDNFGRESAGSISFLFS